MARPKVLVWMAHEANRRLLVDWLQERHEARGLTDDQTVEADVDLLVLDLPTLQRHQAEIQAYKEARSPLFLPVLLALPRTELHRVAGLRRELVDELILTPIQKIELQGRLSMLWRARALSLALAHRAEVEKQEWQGREQLAREEAEKIRELDRVKSQFANAVAHELRTPLTSIIGFAEFLEEELAGPLNSQQTSYVRQIIKGAGRLETLVSDLLDFARMDAGTFRLHPARGDLGRKLHEIAESLSLQIEDAGLELRIEAPDSPIMACFDDQRIGQVLTNFLHNAIKFTPKGGHIVLRIQLAVGAWRVSVIDSGVGIAEADLPKIFQRFSQLEPGVRKGGTGLGLSIAKALVEAHGGHVGVESTAGRGSCFWFELPADSPACAPPAYKHEEV